MAKTDAVLTKLRKICLSLPETKETPTWGHPHFRVGEKIFCGYGETSISFKLEKAHAEMIIDGDRFRRAAYVGRYGWVSMDASRIDDWDLVRDLILESFRLIAPKKIVAQLP